MGDLLPFRRVRDAQPGPPREESRPPPLRPHVAQPRTFEPLWREAAGGVLRAQRHRREQTLAEVAGRAGISVQYLSEVERGRKEPSSEVLGAVAGALDLTLADLTLLVLRRLHPLDVTSRPAGPSGRPSGPVALAG